MATAHEAAFAIPNATEAPLVVLLDTIDTLVERFTNDRVNRVGVAKLIVGTLDMLNADWGDRFTMGMVDDQLRAAADRLGFDVDVEEWRS